VRYRLSRYRAADLLPGPCYQRKHRGRTSVAVEPEDRSSVISQALASIDIVLAVVGGVRPGGSERHHRRKPKLLAHLQSEQGLAEIVISLRDHEVSAFVGSPADLLCVHDPDRAARGRV